MRTALAEAAPLSLRIDACNDETDDEEEEEAAFKDNAAIVLLLSGDFVGIGRVEISSSGSGIGGFVNDVVLGGYLEGMGGSGLIIC
jgi:hypothetical protein